MSLRRPPLYETHAEHGAKFTGFGGWEMPVTFDSIRAEHAAVRESVGRFDVSHMGQIEVTGPDATELTQRLTTNDVTALGPGEGQYAALTTAEGILIDDAVLYRLPGTGEASYLLVPNAGQDRATCERWLARRDRWGLEATVHNATEEWGMIALQGPDARERLGAVLADTDSMGLSRFGIGYAEIAGVESLVARTGYTGEDGFELLCPSGATEAVWTALDGVRPCGLGARDTLRIEMGFLLSGQDFHPEELPRTPYEAGIGFVVDLEARPHFLGRDALRARERPETVFGGLVLRERGVPRNGYEIVDADGTAVGQVTSGTISPTLGEGIALGYLPPRLGEPGTELAVRIRGEPAGATVVSPPFL